ncbi:hypothetical protein PC112_g23304 [Phytophthora cactorum]|uniref:Uncharacterized protein n=3 Tax=Phytophthora cactorum TaxID=29920 RepID=A0A8T1AAR7_9STRA|nr:hypothetical protein PC112_g23304 [Phytophthora cactorum]KAG2873549.1 hypothetical protein PC115_g24337 [Phytophthora cactorum]
MMKPNFFEKLMAIEKGMNDDRLEVRQLDRRLVANWETIMRQKIGRIDWKELALVECEGGSRTECVAVMESWAANPSKMDYWIPSTSLCETIDAVAKWTLPDNQVRFCFLQLTKATTHKCNADILWELAQPFVKKQYEVCYIVLIPDEDKILKFRLSPVQITKPEVLDHIRLYVAHLEVLEQKDLDTVVREQYK